MQVPLTWLRSMRYHRIELIRRSFQRNGLAASMHTCGRLVRSGLYGQHRLIYVSQAFEGAAEGALQNEHDRMKVCSYVAFNAIPPHIQEQLDQNRRSIWWNYREMLARGIRHWCAESAGTLVGLAVTRLPDEIDRYFFPLQPPAVLISHCVTLPGFRGNRIYPRTLSAIMAQMRSDGCGPFIIDCADYNDSSRIVIERSGFALLGRGIHKRNGKLLWMQEAPPALSEVCAVRSEEVIGAEA